MNTLLTFLGLVHLGAAFAPVQYKPEFSSRVYLYREPNYEPVFDPFTETALSDPVTEVVPEASIIKLTWESDVAQQIREAVANSYKPEPADSEYSVSKQPFMVGVVGIPGSGKSTSCNILTGLLEDVGCLLMPSDGYHIEMEKLKAHQNADDLIYRRGAPDTFDPHALKKDLESIRFGDAKTVSVPGFDHADGDPTPDAYQFNRDEHNVVITEGLYLLHDDEDWKQVRDFFDLTIYVQADVDICVERLKERNKCIPGYTEEEIAIRCDAVDRVNANTVNRCALDRACMVVKSAASGDSEVSAADECPMP